MDAQLHSRAWDRAIADLARRQHAVVAHSQLAGLGISRTGIQGRLERARLHPVHRGVYSVGHTLLTQRGRWMAAVLAYGPAAVLSHRSAAALWGIRPVWGGRIELIVPGSFHSRRGLHARRAVLPSDEVTVLDAIPVTTVPRTIMDLAAVAPRNQVERAFNEAEVRRLRDGLSLHDLLARYPGRRGTRAVRAILADSRFGLGVTRSELEERFIAFLDEYGLPRPELNVSLRLRDRWIEADCVWRDQRVIVELDGRAAHDTVAAYEQDRLRDRAAAAVGWRTVRVTWHALHRDRRGLALDLRALLAA